MDEVSCSLTVFFEEPFWVGVFERTETGLLSVCKITFGAEPKSGEIYELILKSYGKLKFSPAVAAEKQRTGVNPKRMRRAISKQMKSGGIGTKAQQALKRQQEQGKLERKSANRGKKEEKRRADFELRRRKHKEKHRGR